MYAITADPARTLVTARLAGFMSVAEVTAYLGELLAVIDQPAFAAGYVLLLDFSDASIQSQQVVAAFQQRMAQFPKATRIAILHTGHLARMQIRRVFVQPYSRVAATRVEAEAWLLHAAEPAREASAA